MVESQLCRQQLEEQKQAFHVEVLNRQEAENEDKEKLQLIIHKTQKENKELASKLEQCAEQKDIDNTKFTEEIWGWQTGKASSAIRIQDARRIIAYKIFSIRRRINTQENVKVDIWEVGTGWCLHGTTKKDEKPFIKINNVEPIKQQEVEKSKVGTEILKEYDNGLKTGQKQGSYGPMSPKLSTFDGKAEWKPHYMQFIHIANRYKWDNKQRLDKLIECLRDKALKYYSTLQFRMISML